MSGLQYPAHLQRQRSQSSLWRWAAETNLLHAGAQDSILAISVAWKTSWGDNAGRPWLCTVAGLDGARAGSSLPLGRRTDAVTVLLMSENGTVLWRALNFDRSAVKHALQNSQNKRLCYCRGTARRATSVEILWPFFDWAIDKKLC